MVPKHLLTEKSTVLFVYECARKCLLLSEHKCMSFNYHSKGACELMGAIEGHDHKVAVVSLSAIAVGILLVHEGDGDGDSSCGVGGPAVLAPIQGQGSS